MNNLKAFITPKIGEIISHCDDNYAYDLDNLRFAVSDGASSNALASMFFSELLVDSFVKNGENLFANQDIINKVCTDWLERTKHQVEKLNSPFLRNDLVRRKPGISTFAGMEIVQNDNGLFWRTFTLGDAVIIFIPEETYTPSFLFTTNRAKRTPEYSDDIEFNNSPLAAFSYNSERWVNDVWKSEWQKLQKGTFLLMTDAIAEWLIKSPIGNIENRVERIMALSTQKDFEKFVDQERSVRLKDNTAPLHDDDVTLMVLCIDDLTSLCELNGIRNNVDFDYREQIRIEDMPDTEREEQGTASVSENEQKTTNEIKKMINDGICSNTKEHSKLADQISSSDAQLSETKTMIGENARTNSEEHSKLTEQISSSMSQLSDTIESNGIKNLNKSIDIEKSCNTNLSKISDGINKQQEGIRQQKLFSIVIILLLALNTAMLFANNHLSQKNDSVNEEEVSLKKKINELNNLVKQLQDDKAKLEKQITDLQNNQSTNDSDNGDKLSSEDKDKNNTNPKGNKGDAK